MTQAIQEFFKNTFGTNVILATLLIAVLPIIELRGAIPFGMSVKLWGSVALTNWQSYLYSFLGSSLVVPIIALLFIPILNLLKKAKWFRSLAMKIENRIKSKSDKIEKDATDKAVEYKEQVGEPKRKYDKKFWWKFFGVMLFVAIPLPLTGVYTGTCIAVMLGLGFWWTCLSVIVGNAIAGLLMTLLSTAFGAYTHIILYVFLGLVVVFALYGLIKKWIAKRKMSKNTNAENVNK